MIRSLFLVLFSFLIAAANSAIGHTIWIEPVDGKMFIRFAEPDGRFEKSPGHLDSLSAPATFMLVTNAPAPIESAKKFDHFLLGAASATNTICTEAIFTVRSGRKPYFYARWQPSGSAAGEPLLTLDLVPTGKAGEARAYFRGQPLPGAKAKLRTPDEKEEEIVADHEGFVRFKAEQSGQYLLTIAHHREPTAGFYIGRAYQQTSHNMALTWWQP